MHTVLKRAVLNANASSLGEVLRHIKNVLLWRAFLHSHRCPHTLPLSAVAPAIISSRGKMNSYSASLIPPSA